MIFEKPEDIKRSAYAEGRCVSCGKKINIINREYCSKECEKLFDFTSESKNRK